MENSQSLCLSFPNGNTGSLEGLAKPGVCDQLAGYRGCPVWRLAPFWLSGYSLFSGVLSWQVSECQKPRESLRLEMLIVLDHCLMGVTHAECTLPGQ